MSDVDEIWVLLVGSDTGTSVYGLYAERDEAEARGRDLVERNRYKRALIAGLDVMSLGVVASADG